MFTFLTNDYFIIDDFFYDVAYLNAYIIYKIYNLENKHLCKEKFIKKIATLLIKKNVNCERKKNSYVKDIFVNSSTFEHR